MVPSGVLLFAFDAAVFGGFTFKDIDAHMSKDGEIFSRVTAAHAALPALSLRVP